MKKLFIIIYFCVIQTANAYGPYNTAQTYNFNYGTPWYNSAIAPFIGMAGMGLIGQIGGLMYQPQTVPQQPQIIYVPSNPSVMQQNNVPAQNNCKYMTVYDSQGNPLYGQFCQ